MVATSGARAFVAAWLLVAGGAAWAAADLSLSFDAPTNYTPGNVASAARYVLTVSNASDADTAAVSVNFPAGATLAWTCTPAGGATCGAGSSGSSFSQNVSLPQNGALTWQIDARFASSQNSDPLTLTATADPAGASAATRTASDGSALQRVTAVAVDKSSPASIHLPLGSAAYTVVVSNAGPSDAPGVQISDPKPAGVDFLGWSCSRSPSGSCTGEPSGDPLQQTIDVPAGVTYTYTTTASFALGVPATVVNTASATVPAAYTDANGDDSDSVQSGRDPSIDMSIALQRAAGETVYVPGTTGNAFSIGVHNGHASSPASAPLSLAFPASAVAARRWECNPRSACSVPEGTGELATTVTLAAGADVVVDVEVDYRSDTLDANVVFSGRLDLGPAGVDLVDKTSALSYAIERRANLAIEKTASSGNVAPGASFTYDLVVRNLGPSDVGHASGDNGAGALVSDTFALALAGNPVECGAQRDAPCYRLCPSDDGEPGAYHIGNCPVPLVNGFGHLANVPLRLSAGSSSTIKVFAAARTSASGTINNTASVAAAASTPAVTDAATGNNSSSASVQAVVSTDLQITKTDGRTAAIAGEELSYTLTVVNGGFNTASGVAVADVMPLFNAGGAGFVPGSIRWQCRAFDGGCCTHNGAAGTCGTASPTPLVFADALAAQVDLGPLARVEFTVTGRTDPASTGTLTNTATIAPPADLDSNPANDTSSDDTAMQTVAALSVQKRLLSITPDGLGYDMVYEIVVSNAGPSRAGQARVLDNLDAPLTANAASWTCNVVDAAGGTACATSTGSGKLDSTVVLGVGGSLRFEVAVPTADDPSNPISNTVTVQQGANLASATVVSPLRGEGDLSISKTDFIDAAGAVTPGTENEYVITVANQGEDDVFGARVRDVLPPEFESAAWQCAATTPVPGDLAYFAQSGGNVAARALAVSPDGRHLYVANAAAKSLTAYSRVALPGFNFGAVEALETETDGVNDPQDIGTAVSGLQQPQDVAVAPDGAMVFVLSRKLDNAPSAIVAFNRVANAADPAFGKLAFAGSFSAGLPGDNPVQLEVTSTHLYVSGNTGIAIFRRSASNGLPSFDQLHVAGVPSSAGPLALSIAQRRLFVASSTGSGIASFEISDGSGGSPAGRLALLGSRSDADFGGMSDLVAVPDGQHLYAMAAGSERIGVLSYAGSGANALARVNGYSAAGFNLPAPAGVFGSGARLAVAPDGEHVLVAQGNGSAQLVQLRRDPQGGGLSFEDRIVSAATLAGASDLEVSPDGRHVFIASATLAKQLAIYTRRAPDPVFGFVELDTLADDGVPGLPSPSDIATSSDGRHVYAVSLGDGKLLAYRRNPRSSEDSGGTHLEPLATYVDGGGIQGLNRASRVLVSPDRRYVFVSSEDLNTVAVFDRNDDENSPDFGKLAFRRLFKDGVLGVDGLLGAQGMAMDASSGQLYVAGSFESAVATFRRVGNDFEYAGVVKGGVGGATGMGGMRDLVVSADGRHVMGVGSLSNAVVVLERDTAAGPDLGRLRFLQARTTTGVRLMSIALPSTALNPDDEEHVYVVGQDDDSVIVLKRVVDPASSAFGTLSTLHEYRGLPGLDGARDIALSPDGRRVFVASQYGNSVAIFDRDLNRSSTGYGGLSPLEVRLDDADGADGLDSPYALAVSGDGRNVYVAGFDDRAIASFGVGAGSYCSAAGSGDIDDVVSIGAGGTVQYRLKVFVKPDATGQLCNTAEVIAPPNFTDTDASNDSAEDCSPLVPQGALSISKTDDQLSVVAGSTVRYRVRVDNPGPSSLRHSPANPLTVSDLLDQQAGFVDGSARWTCVASGSGALDFVQARFDGEPGLASLGGVSDLAVIADPDGAGPLPALLAAASVLDDSLTLFARDASDGRLTPAASATLANVDSLAGARAVVARGRHVYVAARASDAVTAFRIDAGPTLVPIDTERARVGLDQASHLVLSADGKFLYVAGANDDGIAVFARDDSSGQLTWVESEQNGIDDASDAGPAAAGLDGVEFLVLSPDGAQLYALSGATGSIARFDRDAASGRLVFRDARGSAEFGIDLAGAAGAAFDANGEYLYVAAGNANRLVVLGRRTSPAAGNYGELRLLSSVAQGVGGAAGLLSPRRVVLSGDGRNVYVTAQAGSSVAWFGRDPFDGSLRFLGLRSLDSGGVDGMQGATGLAIDTTLDQVYVAGTLQSAVVQFERQSDSFCPPSGSGQLDQVPVDIGAGGSVEFSIDVDVESTLSAPLVNTASVASVFDTDASDNQASDSNEPSRVADLSIAKDDGLAAYDGLAGARALAGDARHLYVAGAADNAIGHFTRDDAPGAHFGALHFSSVTRSGVEGVLGLGAVSDLALSSDGQQLYAVSPTENSLAVFNRGAADGRLAYVEVHRNGVAGVAGMSGARAVAQSADGRHLYVVAEFSNALVTFARDPATGRLTYINTLQHALGGVEGLQLPTAVAVSPDDLHVYTLGNNGNTLAVFRRNPNPGAGSFGQLSYLTRYVGAAGGASGLESARSLAFDASGANLYVLGSAPGTLAQFARTAASGELALATRLVQGSGGVLGLAGAQRLRLAPDGLQLLVAGGDSDGLAVFDLAANGVPAFASRIANGEPVAAGGLVNGLAGASDVLPSADGAHLYAVAATDAALAGFERGAGGALAYRETFFDGLGGVAPGESVRYRITVANAGPAAVPNARVVDNFPPQFVAASWTCGERLGGALCAAAGNGNLDQQVNLPAGSSLVFEATGVLGDAVSGTLVNTATVTGIGVSDPVAGNNSATDGNTVLSPALDLVASIPSSSGSGVPGGDLQYHVRIDNNGPTYASSARIADHVPPALREVSWTCRAFPLAGLLGQLQALAGATLTPGTPGLPAGVTVAQVYALTPSALGRQVYAAVRLSSGVDGVLVLTRDPLDGRLAPAQLLFDGNAGVSGLAGAVHIALSGDERFVYVAARDADSITVFARNAGNGQLTFLARYSDGVLGLDGIGGVQRLLLAPGGGFLYAAGTADDAIAVFAVNPASGLLTLASSVRQSQPGMDGLNGVRDLAWSAGATHLFAIALDNQSIVAFARNAATGALTRVALRQEFELGSGVLAAPSALEVDGARLFVASANGRFGEFAFDAATPAFTAVGAATDAGAPIDDLAFEPDQARLYVAQSAAGVLRLYGLLGAAPQPLAQYAADAGVLARAPDGRQLYGGGESLQAWARERGSRCALEGLGGIGEQTVDIAPGGRVEFDVGGLLFANATGELAYEVEAQARDVGAERVPADNLVRDVRLLQPRPQLGASKSDGLLEVVAGRTLSYTIGLDNSGQSAAIGARVSDAAPVFPAATAGLVAGSGAWTCAVEAALTPAETRNAADAGDAALQGLGELAVSRDGKQAYAVNAARDALIVFARQPDGSLGVLREIRDGDMLGSAVQGLDGASAVAVSGDGRSVLVTAALSNSLVVFAHDGNGGYSFVQKLTSGLDNVVGLQAPEDVQFSRDDRYAYVAAPASDSIAQFSRDAGSGRLAFVQRVRDGFGTIAPDSEVIRRVHRLRLSDDGANLYALARGQNNANAEAVSSFAIGSDGALAYLGVIRRSAVPQLAGVRDLTAAPGDPQLYVLAEAAVLRFERQPDGRLQFHGAMSGTPGLQQARAIVADAPGARVYLVDGGGAVTVYARDWSSGALAYRQRVAALDPVPAASAFAAHDGANGELLVATGDAGRLVRFDERPLSHCHASGAGSDAIDAGLDLDVGGHATFVYGARVHPSARGTLVNQVALAAAPGSDPAALTATATDTTLIRVESDLELTKSAPARAVAGEDITFELRVGNAGPSNALGVRLQDALPALLSDVRWTCDAPSGSSCPAAAGNGPIDLPLDVEVGDQIVIAVTARIASSHVGDLANTATLVPEAGASDPTPGDHSASTATQVVAEVDLAVSKDDGVLRVVAGATTTYRIVIANPGPSDGLVSVRDPLPAGIDSVAVACSADGGAVCPANFGLGVDFDVAMPAGSSLSLDVMAQIDDDARGNLANVVTVSVPPTVRERDADDNRAEDIDDVDVRADLAVEIVDELDPFDPNGSTPMPYRVRVDNLGPSRVHDAVLTVDFGRNVTMLQMPPGCLQQQALLVCDLGSVAGGASLVRNLGVGALPAAPASYTVTASVSSSQADPDPLNNTDSATTQLATGGDIDVRLVRATGVVGGDPVIYEVRVRNAGSQIVSGFGFALAVSPELLDVAWTCTATGSTTCAASGSGGINTTLSLASAESVRYVITGTVDASLDRTLPLFVEVSAQATVAPGLDINPANNSALDRALIQWGIFRDGFEALVASKRNEENAR